MSDRESPGRVVDWQIWPELSALIGLPRWGGLAFVLRAEHTGTIYALLLRRALAALNQQPEIRS